MADAPFDAMAPIPQHPAGNLPPFAFQVSRQAAKRAKKSIVMRASARQIISFSLQFLASLREILIFNLSEIKRHVSRQGAKPAKKGRVTWSSAKPIILLSEQFLVFLREMMG